LNPREGANCIFCNNIINVHGKRFCSRSCAAKFNNKGVKRNGAKINWIEINNFMNNGGSYRDAAEKFGICKATISKARGRGDITLQKTIDMSAEEYSNKVNGVKAKPHHRKLLRRKLLNEGTEYKCVICKITKWNEKAISLEVDHIDGNSSNNLLENLRLLCPNCHSQTNTWRGRNTKKAKQKLICDSVKQGSNP
jgi:5-methylcytosine-specific restriction endonuclease McrA